MKSLIPKLRFIKNLLLPILAVFVLLLPYAGWSDSLSMTQKELDTLKIDAAIEGSQDATITLIEYSDMECPFCIRLHNEIRLWENVEKKYGNKVNYIFKNNRGVNHRNTEKKALALICMKKIANHQTYINFYNEVLSYSSMRRLYPIGRILPFIRKQGIPYDVYQRCIKDPSTLGVLNSETLEAQKYDLSGTPGVIIINNKTLKYDIVEGAYPIETFNEKIDTLLQ